MISEEIAKAMAKDCCSRKCMQKITFEFVQIKRTEWSTLNEKGKTGELKKLMEAFQIEKKSDESVSIGIFQSTIFKLIILTILNRRNFL